MLWWQWMILGAALLGLEMFAIDTQFYLVFLGVSAALIGLAGLLGIEMAVWAQWAVFGILSLILMVTIRKHLYRRMRNGAKGFRETLAGETMNVANDLAPGAETRLDYRGTKWTARNTGGSPISGGSRARVVKVDGLTLHIESDQS